MGKDPFVITKFDQTHHSVDIKENYDELEGKISDESPVGLALLGHAIGDAVEVEVPAGVIGFKVLDIFK